MWYLSRKYSLEYFGSSLPGGKTFVAEQLKVMTLSQKYLGMCRESIPGNISEVVSSSGKLLSRSNEK